MRIRAFIAGGAALLPALLAHGVEEPSPEPQSPQAQSLPSRAVPVMPKIDPTLQAEAENRFVPLFRLTRPYYSDVGAARDPESVFLFAPAYSGDFRNVTAYDPPQGLFPLHPREGPWSLVPTVGVVQTYDSNLEMTPHDKIGDTYTTLKAGLDFQAGSPDSIYSEGYDTVLGVRAHYDMAADVFARHGEYDFVNQNALVEGRIGRSAAIWRPFFVFTDQASNDFLGAENLGRIERQQMAGGVSGRYQLTGSLAWDQTFSHLSFEHRQKQFIDFDVWRAYNDLAYRALHDVDALVFAEYRDTGASIGSDGREVIGGVGWRGRPDPRIFTQLLIGYESMYYDSPQPGRRDLSGLYVNGYTTFDYSQRLKLTINYNRGYIFNEVGVNDNYIDNTVQIYAQLFMGGNWYLTPYVGVAYNQLETSVQDTLEIRPELELSYLFPNESRAFIKAGYDRAYTIEGGPVSEDERISVGLNWKF